MVFKTHKKQGSLNFQQEKAFQRNLNILKEGNKSKDMLIFLKARSVQKLSHKMISPSEFLL